MRLGRQRATGGEILVVAAWAGIVGREHGADIAVAIEHLSQIGGAGEDVVARVERIVAERIADAQLGPGVGHDLHQSHRSGLRDRANILRTLGIENGAYPCLGNAEALRCLADLCGKTVNRPRAERRAQPAPARRPRWEDWQAGKEKEGDTPRDAVPMNGVARALRSRGMDQSCALSASSRFFCLVQCKPQSRPFSSDWNRRARIGCASEGSSRMTEM